MIPLLPVALAAGAGWWWWKHRTPAPVQAPPYQAPDGKVYPSAFMVDGNMPPNIAQAVTQMIMLNTDFNNLMANGNWMQQNGYPVAAQELFDKAVRIQAQPPSPQTQPQTKVSGSIPNPNSIWLK
jgi:hypothetical protein